MKGGILTQAMSAPLMAPMAIAGQDSEDDRQRRRSYAQAHGPGRGHADQPMMEPTERSMPPVRITNSSPKATMATNEICRETW